MAESEGGCSNCGRLQAQVAQLQRENRHLRQRVERLRQVINVARAMCLHIMADTGEVLSQKSGVPRAVWAFNTASYTVASKLLEALQE